MAAKRLLWGVGGIMLLLAALFLSMVRISIQPSEAPREQVDAAPTEVALPTPAPAQQRVPPLVQATKSVPYPAFGAIHQSVGIDPVPLIIPVRGVRAGQLSDTWGDSRGGGLREHHAIDIMAPKGTPVLAAASGTIARIFESVAGGHTIYERSRDGRMIYYYAHLDTYGAAELQVVRQGDVIGTVGDTGNAANGAPHLHFEIKMMQPGERWWQGANVNPYPLLATIGDGS